MGKSRITFKEYFQGVEAAYKASFYNEYFRVWGLDTEDQVDKSFLDSMLMEVQGKYDRKGF